MNARNQNELVGRWRQQPTAPGAVEACDSLALEAETGGAKQPSLARSMADEASRAYPNHLEVLLSVGRMLLAHGQLQSAKRHLLSAAKLSAEPRAPRLLGEVLLRQGDAKRAVRALKRAISLGATDDETRGWFESASAYVQVQAEEGREAVARAVDDGFQGEDIVDEDSDDDVPTMVANQKQRRVMTKLGGPGAATAGLARRARANSPASLPPLSSPAPASAPPDRPTLSEAETLRQHAKRPRPERPAVPRDDEITDFVQLTQIAQDGAPTRVAADVPKAIANASLPDDDDFEDEATAVMSRSALNQLNALEASEDGPYLAHAARAARPVPQAPTSKKPLDRPPLESPPASPPAVKPDAAPTSAPAPEPPEPPPPPEPPAPKEQIAAVTDDDSEDAWQLAVQKGPAPQPESVAPPKARRRASSSRTGIYVGAAAGAIFVTLLAGVRTGRLPELAQYLPAWVTGAPEPAPPQQAPPAPTGSAKAAPIP